MAMTVKANLSQVFYAEGTPTANFADSTYQLKFGSRHIKIAAASADAEFSTDGGNTVCGKVKSGEVLDFEMDAAKLSIRGAGSTVRMWAY